MKKYMVADLVKDLRSDKIKEYIRLYDIDPEGMGEIDDLSKEYYSADLSNIVISELDRPFQMFYLIKEYGINSDEANYLVENWDNEADWKQVMDAAEALGIGIEDVQDDDVEGLNEIWDLGGSRGSSHIEVESSIGKFIITLGAYGLTLAVLFPDECKWSRYGTISKETARDLINADSAGEYYNLNIRGNSQYSEMPGSCGCKGRLKKDIYDIVCDDSFSQDLPQDVQQIIKSIC